MGQSYRNAEHSRDEASRHAQRSHHSNGPPPSANRPVRQVVAGGGTWFERGSGVTLGPDGAPLTRPPTGPPPRGRGIAWDQTPERMLAHGIDVIHQSHSIRRPASARASARNSIVGWRSSGADNSLRRAEEMDRAVADTLRALRRVALIRQSERRQSGSVSGESRRQQGDWAGSLREPSELISPAVAPARPGRQTSWSEPPRRAAPARAAPSRAAPSHDGHGQYEELIDLEEYAPYAELSGRGYRYEQPEQERPPTQRGRRAATEAELPWLSFAPG